MYGSATLTKWLAKNKKSGISDDELSAVSQLVDPEIDSVLSERYFWPFDSAGNDISATPPTQIVAIASKLYAALLEMEATAFNANSLGTAEVIQHPYGSTLYRQGMKALRALVSEDVSIPTLGQRLPCRVSRPQRQFNTVSGFSGDRLPNRRRDL